MNNYFQVLLYILAYRLEHPRADSAEVLCLRSRCVDDQTVFTDGESRFHYQGSLIAFRFLIDLARWLDKSVYPHDGTILI